MNKNTPFINRRIRAEFTVREFMITIAVLITLVFLIAYLLFKICLG